MADQYPGRLLKERFTPRRLPDTILEVADEVATAVRQHLTVEANGGSEKLSVQCLRPCASMG